MLDGKSNYDVLVIGGGPGGSTAASLLARTGRRVLVLEKEHFPRFHIGESLLPYNHDIFEELGVLDKLRKAGFPDKYGAQFHLGNASKSLKLVFSNGRFTRKTSAFQVERAAFDDILLKHSANSGAHVLHGWTVIRFVSGAEAVTVEARNETGQKQQFQCRFLIDASGRANVTGNQEKLRVIHPHLKKVSIFGHFTGVRLDDGPSRGDTVIVRLEDKWFWLIPLPCKVSVGCVLDQSELAREKQSPADLFQKSCASSTEMRHRMANAKLVTPMQVTSDFSYYNRRLVGPRLLRVGDAAGFMDPIFSSGVYLAMHSGRLAARAVLDALQSSGDPAAVLRQYEQRVFSALRYYWVMVEQFYTRAFMELFMEPRPKFDLPDAIVAILAGELDGGWRIEARRRAFFLLLQLQKMVPLVPRISFSEKDPTPSQVS